ncbi:hypothetical protein OKW24_001801 [Peribacillus simplex]|uniref:hypothetical protein n=1 Tax=Peribacillus simplex TaxID=1478 RepID=UPI0024E25BEE|nr:hypothetical protein [Peribacillus simplex]MDF9760028.1 hypothetical protein [Peribacillus simplex]
MSADVRVESLTSIGACLNELSDLLMQVVEDGLSIGFFLPSKRSLVHSYWESAINPDVILFVAKWVRQPEVYRYIYAQSGTGAIGRKWQN